MSAKSKKAVASEVSGKIVKISKAQYDACVVCTAKAQGMGEKELEAVYELNASNGIKKLNEITGNKHEARIRSRWNRVQSHDSKGIVCDYWICTDCKRSVATGKSNLPDIFPHELVGKLKK